MTRTPRECIEAVLANLEMAANATQPRLQYDDCTRNFIAGQEAAFRQSIALIRTECASILETNP
jgi:hypothetical protein